MEWISNTDSQTEVEKCEVCGKTERLHRIDDILLCDKIACFERMFIRGEFISEQKEE